MVATVLQPLSTTFRPLQRGIVQARWNKTLPRDLEAQTRQITCTYINYKYLSTYSNSNKAHTTDYNSFNFLFFSIFDPKTNETPREEFYKNTHPERKHAHYTCSPSMRPYGTKSMRPYGTQCAPIELFTPHPTDFEVNQTNKEENANPKLEISKLGKHPHSNQSPTQLGVNKKTVMNCIPLVRNRTNAEILMNM